MKFLKEITKYILIFVILVLMLTTILTLVAKIPRKYLEENLTEATNYFEEHDEEITRIKRKKEYTWLHPYADEIILNIIYCLDTDNPLASVLEAKYYTKYEMDGTNDKYIELIENDLEGNTQYIRYWHGSIVVIKPLLMVFTLEQIYILNAVVLTILAIVLLIILIRKRYYSIAISLVIGLIMVAIWYVPFTFEYYWTFLLMLITSIISICIENKNLETNNKKLYMLFFIIGILTCFFDFFTTEIITILVPLAIILSIRIKEKRFRGFKKESLFLIKSLALWLIAYASMWLAKWGIASVVLKINAMDFVKENAMTRINGQVFDYSQIQLIKYALEKNILTLYPINLIKRKEEILISIGIALLVATIMIIDIKNKEKMKYMLLMLGIAIIPYIRYMVLANHSYKHMFMTFRSQLPTIMCIILILTNCTDKKKLLSKVGKKDKKIDGRKE